MNYYERYCGDYQRDTAHLSLGEHGAYTMLLDTYFSVEKPLPKELPSLYRVCRAMTRIEQQAVKTVAEQFFPVSEMDGLRHNPRADREIAKARPKIDAARINGRKGGRPPKEAPRKEMEQGAPQKPGGLFAGSETMAPEITPTPTLQEPGRKAHQHQHQLHNIGLCNTQSIYSSNHEADTHDSAHEPATAPWVEFISHPECDREPDPASHVSLSRPIAIHGIQETASSDSCAEGSVLPGVAGACCKTMISHGVQGCNPHHPTLRALLQAGAVEEEFVQAARSAVSRGKASFAYVIGTVKRQREEAAKLVLHQGRMPNGQELLEASNKAATEGWLPPELREAAAKEMDTGNPDTREPEWRGVQHANR